MKDIPLFPSNYRRLIAKEAIIPLVNRFVEKNPSLNDSEVSVISRPGLQKFLEVGTGPVRALLSSPGAFDDALFVVSGTQLFSVNKNTSVVTTIGTISSDSVGGVSMAATSPIGTEIPSYLFIAEGGVLWIYTNNGHARAQLTATGIIANGNRVSINGVHYQWTTGSVNAGTPDGTNANPWLVARGTGNTSALLNLYNAINASGLAGTDYSSGIIVGNAFVEGLNVASSDLFIQARTPGIIGNGYTVTQTGGTVSWSGPTLSGGGGNQISQVRVPDDAGAISVAAINSFIIVVPEQRDDIGTTGRFYWIEPGERIIDPTNFANAERSPDRINQVVTFSDMFWLFGENTTEPWVTTGNAESPMQRFQGIIFDRGSWEGTAVKVRDNLVVVDEEGGVFVINNGQRRVSNPGIEERIRNAIAGQSFS